MHLHSSTTRITRMHMSWCVWQAQGQISSWPAFIFSAEFVLSHYTYLNWYLYMSCFKQDSWCIWWKPSIFTACLASNEHYLGWVGVKSMDTDYNSVQKVPSVCWIRVKYFGLTLAKFSLQVVPDNEEKIVTPENSQMPREGVCVKILVSNGH